MKVWLSLGLTVMLGLTQGVGLLMLIPFLGLIGLGRSGEAGGISTRIGEVFGWFGLPLNLPTILCVYVGIVSVYAVATRYQAVLSVKITQGFTRDLRNRLYEVLCRAEWCCFLRVRSSDITHVLTSDLGSVAFATQQLLQLIGAVMIAAVHIAVAFVISVPMTLFALACGGGFLLLLRPLNRRSNRVGWQLRTSMSDMYAALSEHLGGMKVAKSLSLEDLHEHNFRAITHDVTEQMVHFTSVNAATRMYYEIGAASALAAFFFAAVELAHMPATNLLLIVFVFARLLPRFSMIQQTMQRITNALPSFEATVEMEDRFEKMQEPCSFGILSPLRLKTEISLSRVSFRYHKDNHEWVLRDLDLVIPAGLTTALVGQSGAGKSTVADLILGLLPPDEGTVSIDGQPLTGPLLHRWRRSVGYVPQDTFLFHDTIRANLLWAFPNAQESDLWQALRQAAADSFIRCLPDGLDTVVGDRGVRLSGGERQRIALARALLRRPSLLLLDEATSSLDAESQARILEAIERLHGQMTIMVIAHRLSSIRGADRIVVLDGGRIVEAGAWQDLAVLPDSRFRALFGAEEDRGNPSVAKGY